LSEEICLELLYAAHKYDISTLENLIVDTLLDKPDEWFSINVVLELYFFTVNVGSCDLDLLTEKLVDILIRNQKELGNSVFYQELKANNSTQLVDLEVKLLELHKL
ncbi:Copper-transporting ATPase, partial [Orchesella cincta]